ncbi:hypothetical protein V2G26_021387 [Clonostachys chloroleuca]
MDQYQTPQPGHRAGYATLTYPETSDHAGYSQGTPLPPQLTENSSEPGGLDDIDSAGFLNRAVPTSSTADAEGEMLLLILEAFDKAEKSLDDTYRAASQVLADANQLSSTLEGVRNTTKDIGRLRSSLEAVKHRLGSQQTMQAVANSEAYNGTRNGMGNGGYNGSHNGGLSQSHNGSRYTN